MRRASFSIPVPGPVLDAFPQTAQTRYPSIVGKWGIDATKPVPYRRTNNYERTWPVSWGRVNLDDYLEERGQEKPGQEP